MNSLTATYLLASTHFVLYVAALMLTRRPIATIFHVVLALNVMAFSVRPAVSAYFGGVTFYNVTSDWEEYNYGLLYQLISHVFFIGGYFFVTRKQLVVQRIEHSIMGRDAFISFGIGMIVVGIIDVLSGGEWLPNVRNQTITSVVPFGKLLAPLAMISLSVTIPILYMVWVRIGNIAVRSILCVVGLVAAVTLLLLYQRGFLIYGMFVVFYLYEHLSRRVSYRKAVLFCAFTVITLLAARTITTTFLVGEDAREEIVASENINIMEWGRAALLEGTTFDNNDVWPVVQTYVQENGYRLGSTLISLPVRFITPAGRQSTGMMTAVDEVNEFYWGEDYWVSNFGFNVNLAQEIYLNFGWLLLPITVISGLLTGLIDRWLINVKRISVSTIYMATAAIVTGGFLGELSGTIQWVIAYLIVGAFFGFLSRLRWRPNSQKNVSPDEIAVHHHPR